TNTNDNNKVSIEDISFSLQETAFSMLVEVTERALAHTKKKELMLCGGVAANQRLRDMLAIMAEDQGVNFTVPQMKYCGDNGAMIAWMGILSFLSSENPRDMFIPGDLSETTIIQKYRTDDVDVSWIDSGNIGKLTANISKKDNKNSFNNSNYIAKGAEANIYKSKWIDKDVIVKSRLAKNYRIIEIDTKVRKSRIKQETRLIHRSKELGVRTPVIYDIDLKNNSIIMENVTGSLVKNLLSEMDLKSRKSLSYSIGANIAKLHQGGIIHGDLTSSNIILKETGLDTDNKFENNLFFIDFGLGRFSDLAEDKGVDLLVMKKSLQSIDYDVAINCFDSIIKGYSDDYNDSKSLREVLAKLENIGSRGRYN
ncbi:MAG: KEOPS complex kinase/ATPase Bud32, partial [Methanobacteriaceae archaeon]